MTKISYALITFLILVLSLSKLHHDQATAQDQNVDYYLSLLSK